MAVPISPRSAGHCTALPRRGVVHYCVANIPGAVARSATLALNQATLPYVLMLFERGVAAALRENPHLRAGLNVYAGQLTHAAVADSLGLPWRDAGQMLGDS